jgi:TENA/THI-4/PQQC family
VSGSPAQRPDLATAQRLVEELRRELAPVEQEIRRHPYLAALEGGHVRREDLARFAGEQHHIIRSDLRSVALLVNRFGASPSGPFFQSVLGGETAALAALGAFAAAVGMDDARLQAYEPAPGAHAYTAFMAWLALYRSEAEGGRQSRGELRGVGRELRPDEPRPSRPLWAHRRGHRLLRPLRGSSG